MVSNSSGPTVQNDLRAFIAAVDSHGELAHVAGAHWNKELGAVTEVLYRQKVEKSPMLLFDDIPDYPKGRRCAYGMFGSPLRLALVLGMDPAISADRLGMLHHFRKHVRKGFKQVPTTTVTDGPVFENIVRDNEVDIFTLPVPIHHEDDGGRYIGTACGVVTRDPDTGRVNVGTYRVMATGPNTCAIYISNGKQGRIHLDKYRKAGKPCPVAIVVGVDPVTYLAAAYTMPDAVPEYEWAGGVMDRPMELVHGEVTGLPFRRAPRSCSRARSPRPRRRSKGRSASGTAITPASARQRTGRHHQAPRTIATIPSSPAPQARSRRIRICSSAASCARRAARCARGRRHSRRQGRVAAPGRRGAHLLRRSR